MIDPLTAQFHAQLENEEWPKLRVLLCWLLFNAGGLLLSRLRKEFVPCVSPIVRVFAVQDAGLGAASWGETKTLGSNIIFYHTFQTLIQAGVCEAQGDGAAKQIRLVQMDAATRSQVQALQALVGKARQRAAGWSDAERRRPVEELSMQFDDLADVLPRPLARLVARKVAEEFARAAPAHGTPAGAAQDGESAAPGRLALTTKPWWENAGFFERRADTFFPADQANEASRLLSKALAVEALRDPAKIQLVRAQDPHTLSLWLRENLRQLLTEDMERSLCRALYQCAEQDGLPGTAEWDPDRPSRDWWCWLHATGRLDWDHVAGRLREEVEGHHLRGADRALELATGLSFERIEHLLGNLTGPFEEQFLRVMQIR